MNSRGTVSQPGWNILPRATARTAPGWNLVAGAVCLTLGLLLVTRPLTSLVVLAVYVALSAIATGILGLASSRAARWWDKPVAVLWMLGGLAVLVWLGRGLDYVSDAIAVLLVFGGLASLLDVLRGKVSQRVLAAAWGGAQLGLGVLALSWPDITLLLTAFVFGLRTVIFGASTLIQGAVGLVRRDRGESAAPAPSRASDVWSAVGRYALSVVVVGTVVVGWAVSDWIAEGSPVVDSFYDVPDVLPREAGVLLREGDFTGRHPSGATVRRILYTTTDHRGRIVPASGFVVIPDRDVRTLRPAVVWGHGTTGVARGCAPSLQDATATRWAIPGLDRAIENDWIVVAPDYPGQGAEGDFPYLVGEGEGRSMLDAVRAVRAAENVDLNGQLAIWGHSQGGHAALWASQLAPAYAPEFEVADTAALAPAADPPGLAEVLTSGRASAGLSVFVSWVLVPYANAYDDVHLADYVAPGARSIVREMTTRCPTEPGVVVSVIAALGVSEDRPLYPGDLTGGALGRRLAQNVPTGPYGAPVFVAWGSEDEIIPPEFQEALVTRLCDAGESVRWLRFQGAQHQNLLQPIERMAPIVVSWTQDRFDGMPPVDDCGDRLDEL